MPSTRVYRFSKWKGSPSSTIEEVKGVGDLPCAWGEREGSHVSLHHRLLSFEDRKTKQIIHSIHSNSNQCLLGCTFFSQVIYGEGESISATKQRLYRVIACNRIPVSQPLEINGRRNSAFKTFETYTRGMQETFWTRIIGNTDTPQRLIFQYAPRRSISKRRRLGTKRGVAIYN